MFLIELMHVLLPRCVADLATSDPFLKMIENNKTYGFTIAVKELRETVPNIFRYASAYKRNNNLTSQGLWEMFVEPQEPKEQHDDSNAVPDEPKPSSQEPIDPEAMEGEKYNMCHFWSNFEIAKLSWFRSKEYNDFFQMMDRSGGFWMERVSLSYISCYIRQDENLAWLTKVISGVMLLSTLWPPVLSWPPEIFTTSETLGTDTRPSSIVPRMLPLASFLDPPSLR
jgi:hypothetical protein